MGFLILAVIAAITAYGFTAHYISYYLEKEKVVNARIWGLNICCGKTDGGGVNADIVAHKELPSFKLVDDIYNLPFENNTFESVLCSHTLEHVDDPEGFFREMKRVGKEVTIVVPPLYDIFAAINIFEHRTIFLTFKKTHTSLPPCIKLPLSELVQSKIGQINHA